LPHEEEIGTDVLEEGSYYLSKMGMTVDEIAAHFEVKTSRVAGLVKSYASKLKSGEVIAAEVDRAFWEDVKKEAEGDLKLTFVSEKGFHHAWKSELERLDGSALMSIYESSKDFLNMDQNQKFLDFPPPKGYDPLAMDREIRKAVGILASLLEMKGGSNP